MIEVFEIGVSLALGDGVLEGVAAAKRDMHAVEVAMAAGAVSVLRLREAASAALELPRAKPVKSGGHLQGAAPFSDVLDSPERAAPADLREATTAATAPPASVAVPAAPASQALPDIAFGPAPADGSVSPERKTGSPIMDALAATKAAPQAPVVNILRMESAPAVGVSPVSGAPAPPATEGGFVRAAPAAPAQSASQGFGAPVAGLAVTPPAASDDGSGAAPGRLAPAAWPGLTAEAPMAPAGAGSFMGNRTDDAEQSESEPRAAAAAPAGGGREQVRMEGDVFLDGTLVGRWMSGYLAREAGRASAGPTGFDGRRDPLLPGATVGM